MFPLEYGSAQEMGVPVTRQGVVLKMDCGSPGRRSILPLCRKDGQETCDITCWEDSHLTFYFEAEAFCYQMAGATADISQTAAQGLRNANIHTFAHCVCVWGGP